MRVGMRRRAVVSGPLTGQPRFGPHGLAPLNYVFRNYGFLVTDARQAHVRKVEYSRSRTMRFRTDSFWCNQLHDLLFSCRELGST